MGCTPQFLLFIPPLFFILLLRFNRHSLSVGPKSFGLRFLSGWVPMVLFTQSGSIGKILMGVHQPPSFKLLSFTFSYYPRSLSLSRLFYGKSYDCLHKYIKNPF